MGNTENMGKINSSLKKRKRNNNQSTGIIPDSANINIKKEKKHKKQSKKTTH